jgi:DNA repair exonuclease SbcCD ATPase subunit
VLHPALVVLWMAAAGLALGAGEMAAQDPNLAQQDQSTLTLLNDQELRHRAAVLAYEQALAARLVVEAQWEAALDSVQMARQSGDQDAYDRASERHMLLARDLTRMDRRVQQVSDSLEAVRSDYLEAMDARLGVLLELQESALTRADGERFGVLIDDLGNQYRELEASSDVLTPRPLVMQGVLAYSPRDTPSRLRNKIEIADRRIDQVQAGIEEAEGRIEGIEQRIRLERQQENFRTTLGRFDDTRVPVGPPGQSRSQGQQAVSDSTGVRTAPETLDEQLEGWRTLRGQLESMLQRLEAVRDELESHLGESLPAARRPAGVGQGEGR